MHQNKRINNIFHYRRFFRNCLRKLKTLRIIVFKAFLVGILRTGRKKFNCKF